MPLRFAIFASGRGSNANALLQAFAAGSIPGEVGLLISNIATAPVLERAKEHKINALCVPHKGRTREEHEVLLVEELEKAHIDHVLLAGYMRILSPYFLTHFKGRVLNIHPSLLPDFPGLHGAERQFRAGRKVAGATVHFVDRGVDTGEVLLMGSLDVRQTDTEESLNERILTEIEHVIYPRAVRLFIDRLSQPSPGAAQ